MGVSVRVASGDEEILDAALIDLTAFGLPFGRTAGSRRSLQRSLAWRRTTTTYLADLDGEAVGTARVHDMALSTPGAMAVPVSGVGDLGVLPSARGRGVLRALMERIIRDGGDRGHVGAALYASEATIYGRFGFGPATRGRRIRIPVARAGLRDDVAIAAGSAVILEPAEWLDVLPGVYERAARRRGGEVTRSAEMFTRVLSGAGPADGSFHGEDGEGPGADGRFAMVHRDRGGTPQGYALYSVEESWQPDGPAHAMTVDEVVAVDAPAELAVWRALFGVGLVRHVDAWVAVDSPLLSGLADRWAPSVTGEHDRLWVRLIDPVAALAARRYRSTGEITIEITDGGPDGAPLTIVLVVAEPGAQGAVVVKDPTGNESIGAGPFGAGPVGAGPTAGDRADVSLVLAELAELFLGGGSCASLAEVGRVGTALPGAAARLDAVIGWSPLPYVTHDF